MKVTTKRHLVLDSALRTFCTSLLDSSVPWGRHKLTVNIVTEPDMRVKHL